MASSSHEVVAIALQTRLASIQGGVGDYVYTPDLVKRVRFWMETDLDASLGTIYLIRPMTKVTIPQDGFALDRRQEYRILACHRFTEDQADPMGEQIAVDMEADILQRIWSDVRLGRPDVVIDAMSDSCTTDFDWFVQGWVVVELRIVVRYSNPKGGR
jgi:hypothetical protein